MPNYRNGKIYLVQDIRTRKTIYVGGTTKKLETRWRWHRHGCGKQPVHEYMVREGLENFELVLIQFWPCDSRRELDEREEFYRSIYKPPYCRQKAYRTAEEKKEYMRQYREEHKGEIQAQRQAYYLDHQEEKKEYSRKYRAANPEKVKASQQRYAREHREERNELHRKFLEKHPEKKQEYNKRYRERHREERITKAKEKFECECGGRYTRAAKARHMETKKHQDYLATLSDS